MGSNENLSRRFAAESKTVQYYAATDNTTLLALFNIEQLINNRMLFSLFKIGQF
jgi:hypothetical protein